MKDTMKSEAVTLAERYRTESGRSLLDADSDEYIIKPDGSMDFGEISEGVAKEIQEQCGISIPFGAIRLHVGNEKGGLIHAKKHEPQVQSMGYESIEDMIAYIAKHFDKIYLQEKKRLDERTTYALLKLSNEEKKNQIIPIYFEMESGKVLGSYAVLTAFPMRDRSLQQKLKKDRLIYSSPAIATATVSRNSAVSIHDGNAGAVNRGGMPTSDKSNDLVENIISQRQRNNNDMNEKERQEIEDARAVLKKICDARANGRTEGDAESDGKVKLQNMKMEENPMDEDMQMEEMEEIQQEEFAEEYWQEIADSLTYAESPMPEEESGQIWEHAENLKKNMKEFEEAETQYGPQMDTWESYAPQHQVILKKIEQAGDVFEENRSEEECQNAVWEANHALDESIDFFQKEREALKRKEEEYQAQIQALEKEIEEMKETASQMSPEKLADCLTVAMQFLEEAKNTRTIAVHQPRIVASDFFQASRDTVKEVYHSVRTAPNKLKNYVQKKAHKAVDGVLHQVAGVFDKGISSLEKKRNVILSKSHEIQSASGFYRQAITEERKLAGAEHQTIILERRAALRMAQAGFGEYAIEKTLLQNSPLRKEMEAGAAKSIAKDVAKEQQEGKEQEKEKQERK